MIIRQNTLIALVIALAFSDIAVIEPMFSGGVATFLDGSAVLL